MAVDGYIRTAATQLQSAIVQLQGDAHALQRELDGNKQQLLHEIDDLGNKRKAHEAEIAHLQDTMQQQALVARIRSLEHDAEDRKSRIQRIESEIHSAIDRKNQLVRQLQDYSTQFEQLLALPDVH